MFRKAVKDEKSGVARFFRLEAVSPKVNVDDLKAAIHFKLDPKGVKTRTPNGKRLYWDKTVMIVPEKSYDTYDVTV